MRFSRSATGVKGSFGKGCICSSSCVGGGTLTGTRANGLAGTTKTSNEVSGVVSEFVFHPQERRTAGQYLETCRAAKRRAAQHDNTLPHAILTAIQVTIGR